MKIVLIDDEKAMHLIMKRMLKKIGDVEVVGTFLNTAAAEDYLNDHDADIVFMDIHMPQESGLMFAQRLRDKGSKVKLVFVTSHTEYALSAFDVYAYDYIVKPVVLERLQRTVQRAMAEAERERDFSESPADSPVHVQINFLGRMEMKSAQNQMLKWKTSKSAELCGYLLLHHGKLVSRSKLIEDIFRDMPLKNAETYLNTTAYQLRKLLGENGLRDSLYSDGNHYALNLPSADVDLFRFEEGCKGMTVIDESNLEQAIELERLYLGDLFGSNDYPWAISEIEHLSLLYVQFTQRLCRALLSQGDFLTAIPILNRLATYNELDEETVKLQMRALALQKNKEALTRRFTHFTSLLRQEVGGGPSPDMVLLYEQLLSELESLYSFYSEI
ncbi:response regulator [Paenibacillus sp. GCM10012306]|uniref:response regulator n=1 Tax=Paenibacillus sp. GCM10012306 TaxID=3317342 RepID=UPI003610A87A